MLTYYLGFIENSLTGNNFIALPIVYCKRTIVACIAIIYPEVSYLTAKSRKKLYVVGDACGNDK